jgi:hypothetical protein
MYVAQKHTHKGWKKLTWKDMPACGMRLLLSRLLFRRAAIAPPPNTSSPANAGYGSSTTAAAIQLNGKESGIKGRAYPVEGSNNTKLKVQFFWPFRGDYHIIMLAEDYSWAVVDIREKIPLDIEPHTRNG